MIIEISDDSSMVKWKMNDNEDWKSAEISDLIKAYESPKVTAFAENASKEEIEDFKQELENVLERPQGDIFPMEIVAGKCPIEVGGNCPLKPKGESFRIEDGLKKARRGNYVIYDVDFLLDNLAREVNIMESARQWKAGKGNDND